MGPTKNGEYYRTWEVLEDIAKDQDIYFVVALLYDSGYTRKDLRKMMDLRKERMTWSR